MVGDLRSEQVAEAPERHGILSAVGAGKFPVRDYHRAQPPESGCRDQLVQADAYTSRIQRSPSRQPQAMDAIVAQALGQAR